MERTARSSIARPAIGHQAVAVVEDLRKAGGDAGADGIALVHQCGQRDVPALADTAEPLLVGNAHVGEIHLVELRRAARLLDRADFDARALHVEKEHGEALVLRHVRIGAQDQKAVIRIVRAGRPDLLAVDDPVVAVLLRLRAQACDVGTRRTARRTAGTRSARRRRAAAGSASSPRRWHRSSAPGRTCPARSGTARRACCRRPPPAARSRARSACEPRPPYSFGHCRQAQPLCAFFFCQSLETARTSPSFSLMRPSEASFNSLSSSFGAFLAIQPRTSVRNVASCGVSSKFMVSILSFRRLRCCGCACGRSTGLPNRRCCRDPARAHWSAGSKGGSRTPR